jgi:indolepyruvate ferredoxin oxidoreductase alpha subunit
MYHAGFDGPVLGSIGDSTFFHAGIPPMINAVVNKAKITMIVCDNNITAMTGHQPNPGTGFTATGEPTVKVEIANVARGCGVKFVEENDPYDFKKTCEVLENAIDFPEASLVVSRRACAEIDIRAARREGRTLPVYVVDEKKCTGCRICVNDFGCMAIGFDKATKKAWVDPMLCMGCGLCQQICPAHAYNKNKTMVEAKN